MPQVKWEFEVQVPSLAQFMSAEFEGLDLIRTAVRADGTWGEFRPKGEPKVLLRVGANKDGDEDVHCFISYKPIVMPVWLQLVLSRYEEMLIQKSWIQSDAVITKVKIIYRYPFPTQT